MHGKGTGMTIVEGKRVLVTAVAGADSIADLTVGA